jgi:hypothetical protein
MMILVIFRIGRRVLRIEVVGRTEVVELIVYTENGSCQQQELSDNGAVASGNFVLGTECQRDEGKDDGCKE